MSGVFWGVINEDGFQLRSPRLIDGDEHAHLSDAIDEATEELLAGAQKVSVVQCRYVPKHEVWVEIPGAPSLTMESSNLSALDPEEVA